MNKPRYIMGVDPDVSKSGIAVLDRETRSFTEIKAMTFAELQSFLRHESINMDDMDNVLIVIEDSDSTTNWHTEKLVYAPINLKAKLNKAAAIGHGAGMCHATQRHIKEVAEWYGYVVQLQKPLKKCWKGPDGKISQAEASQFMPGLPTRCNQECRDAALLAWVVAGLPIRLKV